MEFETIKNTPIYKAFSEVGKKIFLPRSIFYWAERAKKEAEISGTIGAAFGFEGEWNNFISGIQNGFGVLKKSTEEQSKSFLEQSEENKNKFNQFFKNLKNKWDTQINTWQDEFKQKQEKTKLDWENKLQKIKGDYEKWREEQKQEFKEGMREFSRATIKGAYQFLLFMIPILVVVIVLVWVLSYVLPQ
ncbi:unnamed protein product [marine sediment metagenome]|uniref:Uncharacterized protein n=1 Tax=marine sediment metagenome TaxID=412755 RepID=X0ZG02_9ZZZZ